MTSPSSEEGIRLVQDVKNVLGEGPVWDDRQQALYWIDIEGKKLFRYKEEGSLKEWPLAKRPGSFALREEGGLLVAFEDGFALIDAWDDEAYQLPEPCYLPGPYEQKGQVRLNDGRCDRRGRFIAGGYNGDEGGDGRPWEKACGVYVVEPQQQFRELLPEKVRCANSTAFSPDGGTMYFTDSPSRDIVAYDYDQDTGTVVKATTTTAAPADAAADSASSSSRKIFATIPEPGVPDGSTVDSQGYLWNAEFFSGRVVRYAPDGSVDRVIQTPVTRTTCPALGGADLRTLYITSAAVGCPDSEEGAGGLWAIRVDVPGLPEPRYKG